MITRRQALAGGLASTALGWPTGAQAQPAAGPVYLSDMHFHSFFSGPGGGASKFDSRPLAKTLADGGATLVAWSLVGDLLWFDTKQFKHKDTPKPGEALGWFERELGRIKAHLVEQKLKVVLTPADVDLALRGEPHIVLAVEGATFVENDASHVRRAYDLGLRHLQIVHYTLSPLGDIQTEPPVHNGLTAVGREVVTECNRLGMLIDLAHCTPAVVRDTLALSKAPVVWSHGSVTRGPTPTPAMAFWRRRQLSLETAKTIAQKGGVVGLWALDVDVGRTTDAYADRLLQMADWLGDEHVAFGTDINGLGPNAVIKGYFDVRRVVERWQQQKISDRRIRRIASENYGRALRQAMAGRAG